MRRLGILLLGTAFAVVLMVAPGMAAQDTESGHDIAVEGGHAAMKEMATTADAEKNMDQSTPNHDAMTHDEMNHEGMPHDEMTPETTGQVDKEEQHMDHENMDAAAMEEHDHEAMMEKADASVGIEEKLGNIIADVNFTNSKGESVNLRELTKSVPTILIPIYYRCPDVCNILQGSFAQILPDVALKPGEEIQVVSITFDPRENHMDAARAKKTYLAAAQGKFPAKDWTFLASDGDAASIDKWLDSIGYTVKREGGLYAHPVAVVAIAPGGKVVRYLYGSSFLPFDITMAGTEAATGKVGLSIKRMLSFCYNYDPQGRRYVFSILRVSGFAIVGFVGFFILYLVLSGRKHRKQKAK